MPRLRGCWRMLTTGLLLLAMLSFCAPSWFECCELNAAESREVLLVWSSPPEDDVAGYTVYYGPNSRYETPFPGYPHSLRLDEGDYVEHDRLVEYRLTGLDSDLFYWISVTAHDRQGNESSFSNEKGVVPEEPPVTGCQSSPDRSRHGTQAGWPVWALMFTSVSLWILGLRRNLLARSIL